MSELIDPATGIKLNLDAVDHNMQRCIGDRMSGEEIRTWSALAQVAASTALVHAVRELTGEIRKLGKEVADGTP